MEKIQGELFLNNEFLGRADCEYSGHGQTENMSVGNRFEEGMLRTEKLNCQVQGRNNWGGYADVLKRQNRNTVVLKVEGQQNIYLDKCEIAASESGETLELRVLSVTYP